MGWQCWRCPLLILEEDFEEYSDRPHKFKTIQIQHAAIEKENRRSKRGAKQPVKKPSISNQIRHCISNSISDRPISLHRQPEASPCRLKASIFTDNINRKEYRQYVIVMHKRVSTKGIESLEGMKCVHLMTNCRLHHEIIHHLSEDSERNWNYCELKWDRRTWLDKILK